MNINLNFLETFLETARTLNFSEASKNLRMAQPGLSRQIKQLETSLGVDLFLRDNKRVTLTQEGEFFFERLEPLIKNLDNLLSEVKDSSNEIFGDICIAVPLEFGELYIAPLCEKFSEKYPEVSIRLKYVGTAQIPEMILNAEADFGVGLKIYDQENIRTYKLIEQNSFLLCANKNASLEKMNEVNFASYRKNDPLILSFLKKFFPKATYSKLNFKFCANSHQSIVNYLLKNKNTFAVLPEHSAPVIESLKKKKLHKVDSFSLESTLYLLTSVETTVPKRKKVFKKFLMDHMKLAFSADS